MRILVAMSGGVDSSVAASLLVEAGHDVVGATLKLWGGESDSGCCSVADVDDARRVAQVLGIDHHVFNYTEEFNEHVVAPFVADHAEGRTPNPCIECNRHIKFDLLFARAARLGFTHVATGHHARVTQRDGRFFLQRAVDDKKDQSYVLGYLGEEILSRLVLPIGEMTKDDVRLVAERRGLRTWSKPDSQDLCFVGHAAGRGDFLAERMTFTESELIDVESGELLGVTPAAELLTVGQRRGVTPGRDGERRFVVRVDIGAKRVEVGRLQDVQTTCLVLDEASVTFARDRSDGPTRVVAQWSSHGRPSTGTLVHDGQWRLHLDEVRRSVAPGQSVVWYRASEPSLVEGAAIVAHS